MTTTNPTAYQQLAPCVDEKGHNFAISHPEPGQWGYSYPYCTRCGGSRQELLSLNKIIAEAVQKVMSDRKAAEQEKSAPTS